MPAIGQPPPPWPPSKWNWRKVPALHQGRDHPLCAGPIHTYAYRYYPPESESHERCVAVSWCSVCRDYTGAMVFVPRSQSIDDPLAALSTQERDRLRTREGPLVDRLDRMIRLGQWQPRTRAEPSSGPENT